MCFILKKDLTWLKTWPETILSASTIKHLLAFSFRRKKGEPIAYIIGEKGFWSFQLMTSPCTLIPRPETEMLIEQALTLFSSKESIDILDLGTGTGAIAMALSYEFPNADVFACDRTTSIITLAQKNAERYHLKHITFFKSDWFCNAPHKKWDLIVSNPPYIDENDPHLEQGDIRFEPRSALVAKENGFFDIQQVIKNAPLYLKTKAYLIIEHGYQQALQVRNFFDFFGFQNIYSFEDLNGHERITQGQWMKPI
jgi:release factor glutamine methyltransferase